MQENFDYTLVPGRFAHCFHCDCRRAGECLRYQIIAFLPADLRNVTTVNPLYTEQLVGLVKDGKTKEMIFA